MQVWRLYDYHPEPGTSPIEEWYCDQTPEVQAEFDFALQAFSAGDDWTSAADVLPLEGRFLGLYQVLVNIQLPGGNEAWYAAIGAPLPESPNFVLFTVCEMEGGNYDPPLDAALAYWQAWKQGKGEARQHDLY